MVHQIAGFRHGDHVCLIYDSLAEQMAAVVPFVREGLQIGDRCIYIVDDRSATEVAGALREGAIDVEREVARGALQLLTKRDAYLASGEFSPEAMLRVLRESEARALADGFAGLRVTGEMTWALGPEIGCDRLMEYESLANDFFAGSRSLAICQYNRRRFPPRIIEEVLATHPIVVIGDRTVPNPYYEPSDVFLGSDVAARVAWKTRQVERMHAEQERLRVSEEARERLVAILEATSDFVGLSDTGGRLLYLNASARRLAGIAEAEALPEMAVTDLVAADERERVAREVIPTLVEEGSWRGELRLLGSDGREIPVTGVGVGHRDPAGAVRFLSMVARDETEQRERTRALRTSEDRLQAALERERALRLSAERAADRVGRLQALTAALSEAATPRQVADAVLTQGMLALGAIAGGVCLITPDGESQRLISVAGPGVDPAMLESWATFSLDAPYPVNDAARRQELITIASIEEFWERYPAIAQHIEAAGYQGYMAAPLQVDGRAVGSINYNFPERREFAAEDREFLLVLARQAALALERSWLFEAERDARRRAEHANQVKSQFLALMSHELRTPLNAILGYADLLAAEVAGRLTSGQASQVQRIKAGAYHLMDVIDEILTFSRLEAGREEVRLVECDGGELAREAVSMLAVQAADKGIELRLSLDAPGARILTDPSKLRQILLNLLGNAVKFTTVGEVEMHVVGRDDHWTVQVRDTGPGISPDHLERIFEPFTQIDGSSTRTQGGTGLGLTVSRRLAQLLGGDISVESTLGVGSTFTVRLPAEPVPVPLPA